MLRVSVLGAERTMTNYIGQYGKWKILKEIGRGGQGTVYLAHNSDRFDLDRLSAELPRVIHRVSPTDDQETQEKTASKLLEVILDYTKD